MKIRVSPRWTQEEIRHEKKIIRLISSIENLAFKATKSKSRNKYDRIMKQIEELLLQEKNIPLLKDIAEEYQATFNEEATPEENLKSIIKNIYNDFDFDYEFDPDGAHSEVI